MMSSLFILASIFLVIGLQVSTSSANCFDPEFHQVGNQCFKWVPNANTTWNMAQELCQTLDVDLAQPHDLNKLWNYMRGEKDITGGNPWNKWFIGVSVVYKFVSGGSVPNIVPDKHCVILTWNDNGIPTLEPISCTEDGSGYICGYDIDIQIQ